MNSPDAATEFMRVMAAALSRKPIRDYKFQPFTRQNIGRRYVVKRSVGTPHQGERECARRRRQMERRQLTGLGID